MSNRRWTQLFAVAFLGWSLVGCVTSKESPAARLASPLVKLSAAVVAELRDSPTGPPASDELLLAAAMQGKPELQRAFAGVPIKVRRDARNAVLLVCSPDGQSAWLEDASWTPGVDQRWYERQPPHPAQFTLDPAQAPSR